MAQSLRLTICLTCLVCLSCSKDDDFSAIWNWDYWGEVSADLNGSSWDQALIYGHNHSTMTLSHPGLALSIDVYGDSGFLRESLFLNQIPCDIGKHMLYDVDPNLSDLPRAWYSTILADGDVVGDSFYVLETADNFIDITSLDKSEVIAKFQISFLRDATRGKSNAGIPDTIRFTDGYLHTKLNDR